jgi:hypothetical protein
MGIRKYTKNQVVPHNSHLTLVCFPNGTNIAISGSGEQMVALKSCEILDELQKLGITATTAEVIQYLSDYTTYYSSDQLISEPVED